MNSAHNERDRQVCDGMLLCKEKLIPKNLKLVCPSSLLDNGVTTHLHSPSALRRHYPLCFEAHRSQTDFVSFSFVFDDISTCADQHIHPLHFVAPLNCLDGIATRPHSPSALRRSIKLSGRHRYASPFTLCHVPSALRRSIKLSGRHRHASQTDFVSFFFRFR